MSVDRSGAEPAPAGPGIGPGEGLGVRPGEAAVRAEVAGRRLGRWTVARPLLRPRLVAAHRAGPLARPAPVADPATSLLALDLGLDLDTATVRIDRSLIEAWGLAPHQLWRAAVANLSGHPDPPLAPLAHLPQVWACADGAWTTGWSLLPHRLVGCPLGPGPPPDQSTGPPATPQLAALAPAPDLLILTRAEPGRNGRPVPVGLAPLFRLAGLVAAQHPDRLPLELLALEPGPGAFPATVGLE